EEDRNAQAAGNHAAKAVMGHHYQSDADRPDPIETGDIALLINNPIVRHLGFAARCGVLTRHISTLGCCKRFRRQCRNTICKAPPACAVVLTRAHRIRFGCDEPSHPLFASSSAYDKLCAALHTRYSAKWRGRVSLDPA